MWKKILKKFNRGVLASWSQLLWFVLGAILGVALFGGQVSCTTVENAWGGVKDTGKAVVDGTAGAVGATWDGAVGVGSAVVGTGEAVVAGVATDVQSAVDVVTGDKDE